VYAWSIRGAKHEKEGKENQDSAAASTVASLGRDPVSILSVADGHGSSAYPKSAVGAALANLCAQSVALRLSDRLRSANSASRPPTRTVVSLQKSLLSCWIDAINAWSGSRLARKGVSSATSPLSEPLADRLAETSPPGSAPSEEEADGKAIEAAATGSISAEADTEQLSEKIREYGTTLRLALIDQEFIFLFGIGDGATAVFSGQTQTLEFVHTDFKKVGNETQSLISPNSEFAWEEPKVIRREPNMAILLMTDGVSDCFTQEDLETNIRLILDRARDQASHQWQPWLSERLEAWSREGSGDDSSLALWTDLEAETSSHQATSNDTNTQADALPNQESPKEHPPANGSDAGRAEDETGGSRSSGKGTQAGG
jgi:serine/threonine protein phosphatase PrpC